jgi:erythrocyte band 7 integral membrane protein
MRNQIVYTKDNISIDIDTALFFRVIDPFKATYIVNDLIQSLMQMTYVTMRTICG